MTTNTLGQVLYEADNVGRERYMKPYDTLCESTRQEFEAAASAVAAVVREQAVLEADMQRNRADLLAEDIEALHLCLDRNGVPRVDNEQEAVYSMWGRVLLLMEATREQCAQACEKELDAARKNWRSIDRWSLIERIVVGCAQAIRTMK